MRQVIGSTGHLQKLWVLEGLVALVGEEQWLIKSPQLQPLERFQLLIEAVAARHTNSVIHTNVSKLDDVLLFG